MFDETHQKEFDEQGYLIARNLVDRSAIEPLIDVVNGVVEDRTRELIAEGKVSDARSESAFPTRWYEVFSQHGSEQDDFGWHTSVFSEAMFNLITKDEILDLAETLVGGEVQFNGDFFVRPKLPSEKITTLPWHQDSAYMPGTEKHLLLTLWMPLVPVDEENGALQFIPGSHRSGLRETQQVEGERFKVPVADPSSSAETINTLDMHVGDVLIFNNMVFHRSLPNKSNMVRWSADFRYSSADTPLGDHWGAPISFVARSRKDPSSAATIDQWRTKWDATEHRER